MVGYCFFFLVFVFVLGSLKCFWKNLQLQKIFFFYYYSFYSWGGSRILVVSRLEKLHFFKGRGRERERERERERIGWWGVIETVVLMAGIQSTNLYFFSFFFLLHFTNFLLLLNNLSTLTSLCFTLSTQLILLLQYTPLLFQFWFVFCFTLFNQ